ncbi:MAG: LPS export ABC transporter periplasmic protein LptC [Geobacteraceae bacterium]
MRKLKKIRHLLALAIVVATLLLVATIAVKMYQGKRSARTLPQLPRNIDLSMQQLHYTETRNGVKKWDLLADKAEYDRKSDLTRLTGIRMVIAGDRRFGELTLIADRGEYHNTTRDVRLIGHVEAKSTVGMEFKTGHLSYNAARAMLQTTDRLRFTDGSLTVEGVGLELMTEKKSMKILSGVIATIRPGARL